MVEWERKKVNFSSMYDIDLIFAVFFHLAFGFDWLRLGSTLLHYICIFSRCFCLKLCAMTEQIANIPAVQESTR